MRKSALLLPMLTNYGQYPTPSSTLFLQLSRYSDLICDWSVQIAFQVQLTADAPHEQGGSIGDLWWSYEKKAAIYIYTQPTTNPPQCAPGLVFSLISPIITDWIYKDEPITLGSTMQSMLFVSSSSPLSDMLFTSLESFPAHSPLQSNGLKPPF